MDHAPALIRAPAPRGVRRNYAILRSNELAIEEARATRSLAYQDYDPDYAVALLFSSEQLSAFYMQYYRLPPDTRIARAFASGPSLVLNGQEETVLRYEDRDFLPIRPLVEAKGGSIRMITDFFLELRTDGETMLYHWPTLYTGQGALHAARDILSYYGRFYISRELARQLGLLDG